MTHLTMGHVLYVVAAIDALFGIVTLLSLRKAPPPAPDGTPQPNRLVIVFAIFVTAIALVLIGTFTEVARIQVF